MSDDGDSDERSDRTASWFDAVPGDVPLPDSSILTDVASALQTGLDGATPDPDAVEAALDGVALPNGGDLDVAVDVIPDEAVSDAQADAIVEAGGEAVDVVIQANEATGDVLVDTGGEVFEIAVEGGGEVAAEAPVAATAELVLAALDGV
jgi:hypothetical protein